MSSSALLPLSVQKLMCWKLLVTWSTWCSRMTGRGDPVTSQRCHYRRGASSGERGYCQYPLPGVFSALVEKGILPLPSHRGAWCFCGKGVKPLSSPNGDSSGERGYCQYPLQGVFGALVEREFCHCPLVGLMLLLVKGGTATTLSLSGA